MRCERSGGVVRGLSLALVGVLFTGFLAYWAGVDAALAAYPLARGEHYSFTGPIRAEQSGASDSDGSGDPPHWMGL